MAEEAEGEEEEEEGEQPPTQMATTLQEVTQIAVRIAGGFEVAEVVVVEQRLVRAGHRLGRRASHAPLGRPGRLLAALGLQGPIGWRLAWKIRRRLLLLS